MDWLNGTVSPGTENPGTVSPGTDDHDESIIIVGGGPAGIATGIQLRRHGMDPLLLEGDRPGGLIREAFLLENLPGHPVGIQSFTLMNHLMEHVLAAGLKYVIQKVIEITHDGSEFHLTCTRAGAPRETAERDHRRCTILVLATGTYPRMPSLPINPSLASSLIATPVPHQRTPLPLIHTGVYALRGLRKKTVAIIGAGDAAFDYALNLGCRNMVHILARSESPSCIPVLRERVEQNPRITYRPSCTVTGIHPLENGTGLDLDLERNVDRGRNPDLDFDRGLDRDRTLDLLPGNGKERLRVNHLVCAVGREPDLRMLHPSLDRDRLTAEGLLYTVGDVANGSHRQTAIAMGDGVRTAMKIAERLRGGRS